MDRDRITVSPEDLRKAMTVWLRVMPRRIWRELEKQQLLDKEKRGGEVRYDPVAALADYMAGKFAQAGWEASYPNPPPMVDMHKPAGG